MGAEGTGDAARMDEMDGVADEFIRCAPLQSREPREGKTDKGWWTLVTTATNHETQQTCVKAADAKAMTEAAAPNPTA